MEYRNCYLCKELQEVTPEAERAWDDMIGVSCLCTACYWRLKGE